MTTQSINVTTLDGNLGRTPDMTKAMAMCGICSSGTAGTPVMLTRVNDVIANLGAGPLADHAAYAIKLYGIPVLACRVAQTAAGTVSAVTRVGTGTSVCTVSGTPTPNNDYEIVFEVVAGGTVGTAGVTFQWSLDGGRTKSAITALGTATTFTIPGAGGVILSFATGTLLAGETCSAQATSATWATADLTASVQALARHTVKWECLSVAGNLLDEDYDAIEVERASLYNRGRDIYWVGGYRVPEPDETEAEYLAAWVAEFATRGSISGGITAGGCKVTSAIDGRKYRRPVNIHVAPLSLYVSEEIDISAPVLGPLVDCEITDDNGNPEDHDEMLYPGLDDAGAITLRTWDDDQSSGVYINNPRLYSPVTSDYEFLQHRRVLNLGLRSLRPAARRILSKPIRVSKRTGYITETQARGIENYLQRVLESVLLDKPKASGLTVTVSRTDNILSTKTLTIDVQIVPLAYPKTINISIGFYNPALVIQAA